jgi:prolyl oligopeptidase
MRRTRFTTLTASLTLLGLASLAGAQTLKYPKTPTVNTTDNYHGSVVADPYRWLEDDNASETKQWVEDQNKVTFAYLDTIPQREKIRSRLTQLWNYEKYGMPSKDGGKYFFFYNTGLQPQSVLFVTSSLDDKGRVLIDPNALTADGTAALAGMDVTEDGAKIAYGVADAGSDWNTWRVRDVATGKDLEDEIKWVKFSGASWTKDGKGFFYSRFDAPEEGKALTGSNFYQKLYHHTVGQDQSKDVLVYDRPDQRDWGFSAGVTDDGQYLVINVSEGTDRRNRLFYRDLKSNPLNGEVAADGVKGIEQAIKAGVEFIARLEATGAAAESLEGARKAVAALREQRADVVASSRNTSRAVVELLNDFDASYNFVDNDGPVFLFHTDLDAPRGRVIAIDTNNPERKNWKEIVPQSDATLTGVSVVGGHIITNYLRDAASEVKVYDLAGKFVRNVDLPGIGSAGGFGGKRDDPETFYSFTGYTAPPTIYRYDVASGKSSVFKQAKVDFDPSQYETKQVFYKSKDGTRVPMFISHRKGLELNGANPTLLYGYGGFNISITPTFSVSNLVWMEMGGVYAVANLRGGGEYGEEWHQAGTKLKKQNVFDDFIGAAEWLISSKYTQPSKLAIMGGSNGGLLVGACMTQRPELFGAAIPAVGVLDMLRFHKFTIGHAWRSDYGSSENEDEFHALFAYSPYHALLRMKNPPKFPATMITTADHDDRVVPGHSFKFAAALQAVGAPSGVVDMDRPLLIRVETRAGHGAGKPTAKRIEEAADVWGFLQRTLKVESSAN